MESWLQLSLLTSPYDLLKHRKQQTTYLQCDNLHSFFSRYRKHILPDFSWKTSDKTLETAL